MRSSDVHAGRVGRVREVLVDKVANLPDEGVVRHLISMLTIGLAKM